jgi:pimeloyl-ACP methyl ester carboxylesterase
MDYGDCFLVGVFQDGAHITGLAIPYNLWDEVPCPPVIYGPSSGKVGVSYEYTFYSTNPGGNPLCYYIDWGDNNSEWTDFLDYGANVNHTWGKKGIYVIKAKAKCDLGFESPWSEFEVTMPRNRVPYSPLFLRFLEQLPKPLINRYNENLNNLDINQINVTYESGNYTLYGEIYYPKDITKLYPAIIFCEGNGGYINAYNWISIAIAKEGYVAMIFDFPGQGKSEGLNPVLGISFPVLNIYLRFGHFLYARIHYKSGDFFKATTDSIDYLLEKSPVTQIINKSTIGLIGHSLGGVIVTEVASKDNRIDTVIALSHGEPSIIANITIPIQFQLGSFDMTSSIPTILSCYQKANSPKELISIACSTHLGFTTVFSSLCPCPSWQKPICLTYAIGWFDYFLKNETGSYETITKGTSHLSKIIPSRYIFDEEEHILKYE